MELLSCGMIRFQMKKVFIIAFMFLSISCQKTVEVNAIPKGVVSSAHPLATESGIKILEKGGNAFDAAVAIASVLNVVEPMMSGVGGYGTILIYDSKKKEVRYLDSSGKIPLATNADLMRAPTPGYLQNRRGAKAVSTPGNVNAWYAMSKEYGSLKWESLFYNAIRLANDGFVIDSRLSGFINYAFDEFSDYSKSFYGKDGSPLKEGELLVQQDLGKTLQAIADKGPENYYKGMISDKIDSAMKGAGGFLAKEDLVNDKAEWWDPVKIKYKDFEVYTASPPATAFPSLIRLGLISRFENLEHNTVEYLHLFAEVTKQAYKDRLTYAGDPEITPPPLNTLLSEGYWSSWKGNFDPNTASVFQMPGEGAESKNTTHFVVADQYGNVVSATQTLGNLFGSKIMPEGTGIWLNNSLAYCTYEPKGNPMDAIPGQRKLSGDCPTIIFRDDLPWVALGTPGGHTIGQTVPQMVLNLIEFDMSLQDAIDAPRVSFIEPNTLAIERGISATIVEQLARKGHSISTGGTLGLAHALMIIYDDGKVSTFEGIADKRGTGLAQIAE